MRKSFALKAAMSNLPSDFDYSARPDFFQLFFLNEHNPEFFLFVANVRPSVSRQNLNITGRSFALLSL
jgi:hypothetical protein